MLKKNPGRSDFLYEALSPAHHTRVVDVGANPLDDPPYRDLLSQGHCHVYGFEPQKQAFEALIAAKSEHETYFPHVVGDGNEASFNIYRQSGLSSTFDIDHQNLEFLGRSKRAARLVETETVETKRLDDLKKLPRIDLLKIDVQGAELAIFQNAEKKLRDAVCVITEMRFSRLYRDEPMLDRQFGELLRQGFAFHKFLFIKATMVANSQSERLRSRALRNQAIDGDAVFIRDLSDPAAYSDEQLKHLALAADSVFESYDLVVRCLDLLAARGAVSDDLAAAYVDHLPDTVRKG